MHIFAFLSTRAMRFSSKRLQSLEHCCLYGVEQLLLLWFITALARLKQLNSDAFKYSLKSFQLAIVLQKYFCLFYSLIKISDWPEYEGALSTTSSCETCSGSHSFVAVACARSIWTYIKFSVCFTMLHIVAFFLFLFLFGFSVLAASHFLDHSLSFFQCKLF